MVVLYYPQNTPPRTGRLPLSVLALAAVLEGRVPYSLVDGNVTRRALPFLTRLLSERSDVQAICFSVMPGTQMLNAIRHARELKARFPQIPIVWGGYFPSMHTESVLNSSYVDYVIRGQGERSLPELLDAVRGTRALANVHNLSYSEGTTFRHNPSHPVYDPNERPDLPYEAVDMEQYALATFIGERTFCHETSVGCPHKCNFCGVVDVFNSRWKGETPERTVATLRHLKQQYAMDAVEFHDSEMFVSEKRIGAMAAGMVDLGISWWAEGRIDTLLKYDRETWKLMQQSGLKMIFFGAESGLNDTLALMDKGGVTVEKTKAIAALCREYGVRSEFSFVMGSNPDRTEEDIDATISLVYELERINPDSRMHPFVYTPVPFGTIYDKAVEGGLNYPKNLDEWASHEWTQYTLRRNPHTPWLTKRLHRKIINFRAVQQAYHPKTNDRILESWKVKVLRLFSAWRYRMRFFTCAYELRFLLRVLMNPAPRHEGF